ncbi:hypothetical protein KEM54_001352 [Ascosphaera aggregata]|nr:hypothetical protein KEM54_001352 [Ascosphaera aggregata]
MAQATPPTGGNMPVAMGPPPNRFSPVAQMQPKFSFANPLLDHDRPPPGIITPVAGESESATEVDLARKEKLNNGDDANPGTGPADKPPAHTYGGPIKFYSLAKSLYGINKLRGSRRERDAVLFAAADSKTLSDLLPLACSMAEEQKGIGIHFAVMGREQVSLEGLQRVNNWAASECPIIWHDARPDYGLWSTDKRMLASTRAAMIHLYNNIKQSIVITHEKTEDEAFFFNGIKEEAEELQITHIALPGQSLDFSWMPKLNINSLQAFNAPSFDILVQASASTSGSLIRLLRTLERANYFGSVPSLTIELPQKVDPFLSRYLAKMQWPPESESQMFTVRRRISPHDPSPEEAAIRTVDAIYPKASTHSHVLVLSPQTVLSPSFYHYLKYTVLHYKYSGVNRGSMRRLMGISLDTPSTWPTTGEAFKAPEAALPRSKDTEQKSLFPMFLWQVPDDSATLYFGDKWIELHSFLHNRRVVSSRASSKDKASARWTPTLLKKYPAWLDYTLDLMRARGYYMLYPSFKKQDDFTIAAVHNELWKVPEEFAKQIEEEEMFIREEEVEDEKDAENKDKEQKKREKAKEKEKSGVLPEVLKQTQEEGEKEKATMEAGKVKDAEVLLTSDVEADKKKQGKKEDEFISLDSEEHPTLKSAVISDIFQVYAAGLPDLSQLVIFPHTNKETDNTEELTVRTAKYVKEFVSKFGGCKEGEKPVERKSWKSTDDLFCLQDEEIEVESV